jgi:hypothetical protein
MSSGIVHPRRRHQPRIWPRIAVAVARARLIMAIWLMRLALRMKRRRLAARRCCRSAVARLAARCGSVAGSRRRRTRLASTAATRRWMSARWSTAEWRDAEVSSVASDPQNPRLVQLCIHLGAGTITHVDDDGAWSGPLWGEDIVRWLPGEELPTEVLAELRRLVGCSGAMHFTREWENAGNGDGHGWTERIDCGARLALTMTTGDNG